MSATQFRQLPIKPSALSLQPPNGVTLINLATNLIANPLPQTFATSVIGIPVTVRATPSSYVWNHGDGTTQTTSKPGCPYPNLDVTHTYRVPGRYSLTFTTEYIGYYSLDGDTWHRINGTATATTPVTTITAKAATTELVAPNA